MKKLVFAAAALFLLSLAACSDSAAPAQAAGNAQTGIVMLDAGVWPENDYTQGLPIPPGRVAWAMLDPGHESCSISLTDLTENDYRSYRKQLEQAGFTVLEETSEEVRGQAYVSIGTLLSGETVSLSMSYIPGSLTLYLRRSDLSLKTAPPYDPGHTEAFSLFSPPGGAQASRIPCDGCSAPARVLRARRAFQAP